MLSRTPTTDSISVYPQYNNVTDTERQTHNPWDKPNRCHDQLKYDTI